MLEVLSAYTLARSRSHVSLVNRFYVLVHINMRLKRNVFLSGKQEARGLDAGPRLFDRLMGNGDARSASISKRIAEEEVGHVAVGVTWFVDVCRRLGLDPANRFQSILYTDTLMQLLLFNTIDVSA